MCYYISITPKLTDIERRFSAKFTQPELFHSVYSASAFSHPAIPVISNEKLKCIDYFEWGLIPFWVKDRQSAGKIRERTLNARAETIFEKPSFRHSIRSKRCLIIADGFFEWRHENNRAYPYYITLKHHTLFALAGIWDDWLNPDTGELIRTFSIITTNANPLLEKIHNTRKRMPVILQRKYESQWLDNNLEESKIRLMLNPYIMREMEAYTIPNIISKLGFNISDPRVLDEYHYPELANLGKTHL